MAFLLVVEDGTGVSGANSYCSRDAADAYHEGILYAEKWQEATEADKDRALAMATRLLDAHFRQPGGSGWSGARVITTRDSPAWPRSGTYDTGGLLIAATTIPTCLIEATAEFARRLIESNRIQQAEDTPVSMSSGGRSKSYGNAYTRPIVPPDVLRLIEHLTVSGGGRLLRVA